MNNNWLRYTLTVLLALVTMLAMSALVGCTRGSESSKPPIHLNPNMDDQPKYEPQETSFFFKNGADMQTPVEGTVARGELREDIKYFAGKDKSGQFINNIPVPVTKELLKRGKERFGIYCVPCHSRLGDGQGLVIKNGFAKPPTFHIDSVKNMVDGHYYDVITNGIRNMPSYRQQVTVADRWAIVAYIRELQRNYKATTGDVKDTLK